MPNSLVFLLIDYQLFEKISKKIFLFYLLILEIFYIFAVDCVALLDCALSI